MIEKIPAARRLYALRQACRRFLLDFKEARQVPVPIVPLVPEDQDDQGDQDGSLAALRDMRDRLNRVSPSFCLAKWLQVTLHLHNGQTHSCHHVVSHKVPLDELAKDPAALHNTSYKKKLWEKIRKGQRPSECQYCWNFEDVGRLSDRHYKSSVDWAEPYFDRVIATRSGENIQPTNVEVSFENTCNFKCMYCGPQFSSKWGEEVRKFGSYPGNYNGDSLTYLELEDRMPIPRDRPNPYIQAFWKWWPELVPNLRNFRITGGEPLLSQHTWRIFDFLAENPQPNMNFSVNSNLGSPPQLIDRLVSKINGLEGKVRNFNLYVSMDTVGQQAEYIRYGLDYEAFLRNVSTVLEQVRWPIWLSYMITVNALSVTGLSELLQTIYEQKMRFPNHTITIDTPCLLNPPQMSVKILTPDFREHVLRAIRFMESVSGTKGGFSPVELQKLRRILSFMSEDALDFRELRERRRNFVKMFSEYDRRRNLDFHRAFPEYREFWEGIRKECDGF
jgi:organic radical activating enzyme